MKFNNTEVFNFEGAIRGMRNPLESWNKSDSINIDNKYIIGENDLELMQKLINSGSDHSKFMRQIIVSVDITAPLYWWKEEATYKVGTVENSTSTMHKLSSTPITKECFEFDEDFSIFGFKANDGENAWQYSSIIENIICDCEMLRQMFLKTNDKKYWRALIQILPESWLQTRTCTLNYQVLRNMYQSRKNHKLTEWSKNFCSWVETLPFAQELIVSNINGGSK